MQIIHKIDDFLFAIFPELETGENNELIVNYLKDYCSFGPHQPSVRVDDGWVIVEIDLPAIAAQEAEYQKAVALCEKGRYAEAKPILRQLIAQNPGQSEYHRIMGQALSEEGEQDQAIDCLIDALRWDPANGWALAIPEMLAELQLPFEEEYAMAEGMVRGA